MSLRERKLLAARTHVADAAVRLFLRDGYVATTTRKVATAAGVAEGTVFNLFGSKAGLLLAALQRRVPDGSTAEEWSDEARRLSSGREVVALFCRTGMQVASDSLPLVRVFLEAAVVDATVAEAWRDQEAFRLRGQRWVLDVLAERGWLRTDRDADDLARDLWVLGAPEIHIKCLDSGMDPTQFESWQLGALCDLLLAPTD